MDARWWPVREERLLNVHTLLLSLLNARMVIMVGIEYDDAIF